MNMTPRPSHGSEKENHALAKCIAAANRGWMSEKVLPPADRVKCFFLTSPFIEPGIPAIVVSSPVPKCEGPGPPSFVRDDHDLIPTPAHRDETAMNEAQILNVAPSWRASGPPALVCDVPWSPWAR